MAKQAHPPHERPPYRGRFAPSPTGLLHFGSLVTAVGSYLDARHHHGEWLVRIEDLDRPRTVPGSADSILQTLDTLGFEFHRVVLRQSSRDDAYAVALAQLRANGDVFDCSCSRAELALSRPGQVGTTEELFYPGWCRNGIRDSNKPCAARFRVRPGRTDFDDRIQGPQSFDLATECGDFVVRRKDGLYAYQLAVVVDDAYQSITHVVRGADLLSSTPRQIALQRALCLPTPKYAHLPVATDGNGIKLSKSQGSAAVDPGRAVDELHRALRFLAQEPPEDLLRGRLSTLWEWAFEHWCIQSLQGRLAACVDASE
ncbi:MAG TPA: tRNA glutamyl-Q(34) synthetase GluQRS [Steroidobacteraceae bacterium]|nr:tRNA glutamyl-Q(34) synthetase GluQRS [Steroidobacteraceae bacterium]